MCCVVGSRPFPILNFLASAVASGGTSRRGCLNMTTHTFTSVLTLIGYRGTGKSSVAPALSAALGCAWVDADRKIEQQAGCSIAEIFQAEGEPGFRRRERDVMSHWLGQPPLVLAAGGGAILDERTRTDVIASGPVVWLRAAPETIAARLSADQTTASSRPRLTAAGGLEEVKTLLAEREPLYRSAASCVIDTDEREISSIVNEIVEVIGFRRAEDKP